MTNRRTARSQDASSILELLVAIAITSIAVAGLGEVLWINGVFSHRVFNKVDNISSANAFFELFGRDVRSAKSIGNQHVLFAPLTQASSPSDTFIDTTAGTQYRIGTAGTVQTLIFQVPYVPTDSSVGSETSLIGFPMQVTEGSFGNQPVLDTVVYQADLTAGTITRHFFPDPHYSNGRQTLSTVVLTNLEGPTGAGGVPRIFDYVNSGGTTTAVSTFPFSTWTLMSQIQSIMVNVEIKNSGANTGGMKDGSQSANIGIRREFFMRNHVATEGREGV